MGNYPPLLLFLEGVALASHTYQMAGLPLEEGKMRNRIARIIARKLLFAYLGLPFVDDLFWD